MTAQGQPPDAVYELVRVMADAIPTPTPWTVIEAAARLRREDPAASTALWDALDRLRFVPERDDANVP